MTEQSSKSRRRAIAGRVLLGSAIVALPLTASISYAESVAPAAPAVPAGPVLAPAPQVVPPLAPVAPQAALQAALQAAPEAPQPPVPPTPPAAPSTERRVETVIVTVDPDTGDAQTTSTVTDGQSSVKMKDKSFTVITEFDERETGKQKKKVKSRYQTIKLVNDGSPMSKEEREALLAELRESLAEADAEIDGLPERLAETMAEFEAMTGEGRSRTVVRMGCTSGSDEVSTTTERADGSTEVLICQSRIMAEALQGLKQARSAIAKNREMQGSMRSQILKELDQQIRTWEKETR